MQDITNETDREIMVNMRLDLAVVKERMIGMPALEQRVLMLERRMWQAVGAFGTLAVLAPFATLVINKYVEG